MKERSSQVAGKSGYTGNLVDLIEWALHKSQTAFVVKTPFVLADAPPTPRKNEQISLSLRLPAALLRPSSSVSQPPSSVPTQPWRLR